MFHAPPRAIDCKHLGFARTRFVPVPPPSTLTDSLRPAVDAGGAR